MSAEPPPEPAKDRPAEPPAGAHRAARADAGASAAAERQLNAPSPLALRLLGVVFLATFLPWVAAKAACNLRDSPIRQPHDLPTEVLAKNPKSAALELSQRAASGRYREAAELARGDVARELLEAEARCQAEPTPCERRWAQVGAIFTRAVVASRGPLEATVRTESRVGSGAPERHAMRLEQQDGRWYVVRRTPLEGPIDAPVQPDEVVPAIAIRPAPGHGHGHMISTPASASEPASSDPGAPHGLAPSSGAPSGTQQHP